MKRLVAILISFTFLSSFYTTAYAAEKDDPQLYELAYSLGADTDYLAVLNYSHGSDNPAGNEQYIDYLKKCSLLETVYDPRSSFSAAVSGGSCMGISALEVLAHNGVIKPSDIQEGAKSLSEIEYSEAIDKVITGYQTLQVYTEFDIYEKYLISSLSYEEQIDALLKTAEKAMNENRYFLITIRDTGFSHAVCGIGVTDGSWTFNDTSYDKCVLVLDSNVRGEDGKAVGFSNKGCIYINSKTCQSYIPAYDLSGSSDSTLCFASIDDESVINRRGRINPSASVNEEAASIKRFMNDKPSDSTTLYSVSADGTMNELPQTQFIDEIMMKNWFFKAEAVHVELENERNDLNLRLIDTKRWIDYEFLGNESGKKGYNCAMDFSDDKLSIINNGNSRIETDFQIRMNNGTFSFEPYFWWTFFGKIDGGFTAEVIDDGMLLQGNGNTELKIMTGSYTIDENGVVLTATMNDDPQARGKYFCSSNRVLMKANEDNNIWYYLDDNGDDIYDVPVRKGDINCDGHIDAIDASKVLSIYSMLSTSSVASMDAIRCDYSIGDINNDEKLDATDASCILVEYSKLSTT